MKQFKKDIIYELSKLPNWLDTTTSLHHLVWHSGMNSISNELLKLITTQILTEKTIFRIVQNVNELIDELSELTPQHIYIKIIAYYSKFLIYIEMISIEKEHYEVTENFKKFTDIYYNVI